MAKHLAHDSAAEHDAFAEANLGEPRETQVPAASDPGETMQFVLAAREAADRRVQAAVERNASAPAPSETMQFVLAAQAGRLRSRNDGPKHFSPATEELEALDATGELSGAGDLAATGALPRLGARHAAPAQTAETDAAAESSRAQDPEPAATDDAPAAGSEEAVGRSAAMMSVLVILSRITGFFRTWGQSSVLGISMVASCYSVANNLPNQLYELVVGGMLVTAFLPVYLSVKRKLGTEGASRYASNLVSLVCILMGAVAVLGIVFASQMVWTQSFSAGDDFDSALATYLFRFFACEVILYSLSSIFSGILNAERDYLWSTAAPIFNNFVCTASFFIYGALINVNPAAAMLVLALGNPLGVAIQVIMQVPSLRRHGIRIRPYVDLHDPAIKETLSIGVPSLLVMLMSFVTVSVQQSCALSVTAKGASVSYYARLWYTLPYAILAVPITTTMFTELSYCSAAGDTEGYRRGVASGTAKILFFLVPFAMYLIVFARPLVSILGRFSADDVALTAGYLQALACALPAYGVCMYLQKVCSSLKRMGVYAVANVVAGVIQVAFCFVATPIWGINMVALSSLLYFLGVDIVAFAYLHRELGRIGLGEILVACLCAAALGLAGSAVAALILHFLVPAGSIGMMRALIATVAGGIPAVLVTFGLALALRVPEASFISALLGRFIRR